MSKLNMKEWINEIIQKKEVVAMPIMTHPGIEMIGKTVRDAVTDGQVHYNAIKALSEKYPTAAATVIMDLTVEAEAFGAEIVFPENEVPSVVGRLLANEEDIEKLNIPALNKGQFALIPVSIFLQQELNAAEDVVVDQDEETITPSEVGGEQKGGENTSSKEKEMDLPYTAKVGQEVTNIAAVNASIDAMPITRGLSDDEVKKVLKALVKSYSPGITDVTYTKKVTVPAYTIVTLKTTTEYETSDNTISTVVDGKLYTIPNVKIKKVVKTVVDPVFTSTEHGHGHGHGNGNNAGGGDGAAE